MRRVSVIVAAVIMMTVVFIKTGYAETLYGCPNDKIMMLRPGTCPDGSEASAVREGNVFKGNITILDTLTTSERENLKIRKKFDKTVVVIYESEATGEASFRPGKDKLGANLKKSFVELNYNCGNILSKKRLSANCIPVGETSETLEAEMSRKCKGTKPMFFKEHKEQGLDDEAIESMWEKYEKEFRKNFCDEHHCDEVADKFKGNE